MIVGALARAAALPAITLGPSGGLTLSGPAHPALHPAARRDSANRADFKVPFDVDVQPKPVSGVATHRAVVFVPMVRLAIQ
jgi:hypothetical protein